MISQKKIISIVIPCYNEEESILVLRGELSLVLDSPDLCQYEFEVILVDDGSRDNTWELITRYAKEDTRVRAVRLSRNFGHQMAITCGYDLAKGDVLVSMDADLQDPPNAIIGLVREWEKGFDIVWAVRSEREGEGFLKIVTAAFFYRLFHVIGNKHGCLDAGDFRLMSRRSLDAFRLLREEYRYIRGMVGWLGFRTSTVEYQRKARKHGRTKFSFIKMCSFAMDAIVSFSFFPLRLAYLFSLAGLLIVTGFMGYAFILKVCYKVPFLPGWLSLLTTMFIFGFLNLFSLGIIGEYIGRIYGEVKKRPLYLINSIIANKTEEKIDPYPVVHSRDK